jgi:flavin reductase (DIM6/NTAB) family NADH-FMN oxidoreductase RutF
MSDVFNALMGELDEPMFVVTASSGGERDGCLVGFATQTSIDPPRFLVCLSRVNRTYRLALAASVLAVHVVPADRPDLAELFGAQTGDEVDKLAQTAWQPGPQGVPLLSACASWFVGTICARFDTGDHESFLLAPISAAASAQPALGYQDVKEIHPGHPA